MNHFILLGNIGTDLAGMAKDPAATFGVDWPHFIAQVISFLIVCAALYKFAYKPVLGMLEERRVKIAEGLANVYQKFKQSKVPAELHIYSGAGHGFGLRSGKDKPAGKWIVRFEEWLADSGLLKKP